MIAKTPAKKNWLKVKPLIMLALALAFCAAVWPAFAQQNHPGAAQAAAPPPDSQAQSQPDSPPTPPLPDTQTQGQSDNQAQGQPDSQAVQPTNPPAQAPQNQATPPQSLTLPAGTVVRVRVEDWLSSDRNFTGDSFSAELAEPLVVNGWVVARRGQSETGRVTVVQKGHAGGASQLGVEMPELTLVDGQQLPLQTQLFQTSAGGSNDRNVAAVGGTAGLGAVIGAIAGGGTGAAIGAGLGATAGVIGVMSTKGRPTVIPPETVLSFRLKAPVTISTDKSQFAFQPVTQSDYDSHNPQNRPRMARPGPPPPPGGYYGPYPYPYAYPYAYAYPYPWYPGPFVGFGYYGRFGGWR